MAQAIAQRYTIYTGELRIERRRDLVKKYLLGGKRVLCGILTAALIMTGINVPELSVKAATENSNNADESETKTEVVSDETTETALQDSTVFEERSTTENSSEESETEETKSTEEATEEKKNNKYIKFKSFAVKSKNIQCWQVWGLWPFVNTSYNTYVGTFEEIKKVAEGYMVMFQDDTITTDYNKYVPQGK